MTVARDELAAVTRDHPGVAALVLELLVEQRDADQPPPLEIPEHTGPDVSAIMGELDAVTQENRSLREELEARKDSVALLKSQVADVRQQLQAALELGHAVGAEKHEDELAELRAENETLRQERAHELERRDGRAAELQRQVDDLKQQVAGGRVQIESLEGQRAAHLRELHALRGRTAPAPPAAAGETIESAKKPGVQIKSVECKVDGCEGRGPARGNAAGLCTDHRRIVNEGAVVPIDGQPHQRVQGSLQAIAASSCVDCGAKLSQYRDADETRCATHAGVTA